MPRVILLIRTIGVAPTVARMSSQMFFTWPVYCCQRRRRKSPGKGLHLWGRPEPTHGASMIRRRHALIAAIATTLVILGLWLGPRTHVAAQSLPTSVSDKDFWGLVVSLSEPGGFFRSDN